MTEQLEKFLDLPNGRVLAYEENGDSTSKTVVVFFHGLFGIGDAKNPSPTLLKHGVHFIAPTLPGFGNSSSRANTDNTPYHVGLAQDTTALLEHLHPGCSTAQEGEYKLYVSGGSYGTAIAQMIFNAPLDIFPPSKHIVAGLLLAPISPFVYHKDYAKTMTWGNYVSVGPPSRYIPGRLLQRLVAFGLGQKIKRREGAEALIRSLLFDHIRDDEKALFTEWRKGRGLEEGEFEKNMATNMMKSVGKTWDGFLESGDVLHGDWGFKLEGMSRKPLIIVTSAEDKMAPPAWGKWLAGKYTNARLKEVNGGHIAGLWTVDATWEELMQITN